LYCDCLIKDCSVLTANYEVHNDYGIVISGKKIIDIGRSAELQEKYSAGETYIAQGKLAMPGFIDGHTHTSQQLLRGVISDEYPIIYRRFNMPYEASLTPDEVRLCTELSCLEMIKSGITAFADAGGTFMVPMIESISKAGLRATVTKATSDISEGLPQGMSESTAECIKNNEELFLQYNNHSDGRIKIWFQIRSVASCTGELIETLAQMARQHNTGLHMHMSEYSESVLLTLNKFNMREVEYLDSLNALGPNLLAAHCILLNDRDIRLLQENDVKVVHCPRSNLGKGVTKTPQMIEMGISVGLGTDGTAHSGLSMFKEITAFKHSQIVTWGVPYADNAVMPAKTLLRMATYGGAKALGQEKEIGTIEIGKKADLIFIDIDQPHLQPTHNLINSLMEAGESADVKAMMVDGNWLMKDRCVLTLDEERLLFEGKNSINVINKRMMG